MEALMAEFIKCINMKGFDRHRTPRWQMVPAGGERFVALRGGVDLDVDTSDPGVVDIEEVDPIVLPAGEWGHERTPLLPTDRVFKLTGGTAGPAVIQATGGVGAVDLEVDVKEVKPIYITFNFVKDSAGKHTRFAPANATQWVRTMNYILLNQANVEILNKDARWIDVTTSLGKTLTTTSTGVGEEAHLYTHEDPDADINIFLVWSLDITDSPGDEDAFTDGTRIVCEDVTGEPMGEVLAHEVGHSQGLDDQYTIPRDLMYGSSGSGVHLSKDDVNTINP